MSETSKIIATLRRYIIAGLLIWIPLGVTFLAIKLIVDLLDKSLVILPEHLQPGSFYGYPIHGAGIILCILIVLITGMIFTNLVGRKVVFGGEFILTRLPIIRSIYTAVKQLTQTVLTSDENAFKQVLLVEYPRRGIWTLAFQTGEPIAEFNDLTGSALLTAFVPTTPNPTSGFILMLPKDEVIRVSINVEDALKFIMSLGVVTPGSQPETTSKIIDKAISAHEKRHNTG
ncbi:MAG: DUF502 domain-containing protein [Thiotrichaceae bacterium]|nr:DUF502 domain-containing protein [Thiotrichaceae bacterium]